MSSEVRISFGSAATKSVKDAAESSPKTYRNANGELVTNDWNAFLKDMAQNPVFKFVKGGLDAVLGNSKNQQSVNIGGDYTYSPVIFQEPVTFIKLG